MIELFFWTTPNGYKPLIFLEKAGHEPLAGENFFKTRCCTRLCHWQQHQHHLTINTHASTF